jgi:cellulose synthase/poly-beta-1,6-N-acetylglucosamine synthase-like glycosyltransferase
LVALTVHGDLLSSHHLALANFFKLAVFLVVYAYLGYPFALMGLGMFRGRLPAPGNVTPPVTILISAFNEESLIAEKIENTLALDYPRNRLEIMVASESSDTTNTTVEKYSDRGVKLFVPPGPRCGKAATLYAAVPLTKGEIIVFADANSFYAPNTLRKLVRNFADPRIGAVAGRLTYQQNGVPHGYTESIYLRYEAWLKGLESRLFSVLGADGCLFAVRRELYLPLTRGRGDDFELPIQILLQGYGSIFEPEAISREESLKTVGMEFHRRIRCVAWVSSSALILAEEAIRRRRWLVLFQVISHKFLRWFMLVFLLVCLVTSAMLDGTFYRAVFFLQGAIYLLVLSAWVLDRLRVRLPKLLLAPYYFCAIHLAALVGVGQSLYLPGETHTWEKTR